MEPPPSFIVPPLGKDEWSEHAMNIIENRGKGVKLI
jgi:hypothetical protein